MAGVTKQKTTTILESDDNSTDFTAFHKDLPKDLGDWDKYRDRSDRLREQAEERKRKRTRGEM